MARYPGIRQDPDVDQNSMGRRSIETVAAVVHDTIGQYTGDDSGDSQYIEDHGLAQFVVGEDPGEGEQLIDSAKFAAHCNGANEKGPGVEFSRTYPGQPLTEWQKQQWAVLRQNAADLDGIPNTYLDPETVPDASVWVDGGGFTGWISHRSVKTDDGTAQHTDWIAAMDFIAGTIEPPALPDDEEYLMELVVLYLNGGVDYLWVDDNGDLQWRHEDTQGNAHPPVLVTGNANAGHRIITVKNTQYGPILYFLGPQLQQVKAWLSGFAYTAAYI